jgi:3-phosphoshikimate 1-carboxyvinyltransferase
VLDSDDTRVMREALRALGVQVEAQGSEERLRVTGVGPAAGFPVKQAELFLGNSGTSARSLTAAVAFADGHYRLSGVPRMHERPIGDLVEPLVGAGALIEWLGNPGVPPLAVGPRRYVPTPRLRIRGEISSQYVSALLMALAWAGGAARIEVEGELVSRPYVDLTLDLMQRFGVEVRREGWRAFEIPAGTEYVSPGRFEVEADASSASYFLAAGILGGGPVRVLGVGSASLQGDVAFADVLETLGGRIERGQDWIEARGAPPFAPFDLDFNRIPDAAMTAAVLALFARGPCTLRNIGSWRVKETDRIAAMAAELRKFGARTQEGPDFLRVEPPAAAAGDGPGDPVAVATYDDHRMAMCFSLACFGGRRVRILDPGCVAKTFPGYFEAFGRLVS